MRLWVLDTNVVVSGLLSPFGPPGRLIDALLARKLLLAIDDRVLLEYREVLLRPKFQFDCDKVQSFLAIMSFQFPVQAIRVKGISAADPDDTKFLEVAVASKANALITGNTKHYPSATRGNVRVLKPAEAWEELAG
jgi:putative PIN family toxin of toxin-antitoxin system